jgi:predicted nucleic acid-binding protein
VLIDTNVLVYATGVDGPEKGARSAAVLQRLEAGEAGRLSTQVLSEYANTMLRRLPRSAHPDVARAVERLCKAWPVLTVTETTVIEAIRGTIEHCMSFYDAQLWATARLAGIGVLALVRSAPAVVLTARIGRRVPGLPPRRVLRYVCLWASLATPVAGARSLLRPSR